MASKVIKVNDEDTWECAICLGEEDGRQRQLHECAKHMFHQECLKDAQTHNPACPMCRFVPIWASATIPLVFANTRHFGLTIYAECPECNQVIERTDTYLKFINCGHRIHQRCHNGGTMCPNC